MEERRSELELVTVSLRELLTAELRLEAPGDEEDQVVPLVVAGAGVTVSARPQLREISLEAVTIILAHKLGILDIFSKLSSLTANLGVLRDEVSRHVEQLVGRVWYPTGTSEGGRGHIKVSLLSTCWDT